MSEQLLKYSISSATHKMVSMASFIPYNASPIKFTLSASFYINVSYEGFCKGVLNWPCNAKCKCHTLSSFSCFTSETVRF